MALSVSHMIAEEFWSSLFLQRRFSSLKFAGIGSFTALWRLQHSLSQTDIVLAHTWMLQSCKLWNDNLLIKCICLAVPATYLLIPTEALKVYFGFHTLLL